MEGLVFYFAMAALRGLSVYKSWEDCAGWLCTCVVVFEVQSEAGREELVGGCEHMDESELGGGGDACEMAGYL